MTSIYSRLAEMDARIAAAEDSVQQMCQEAHHDEYLENWLFRDRVTNALHELDSSLRLVLRDAPATGWRDR